MPEISKQKILAGRKAVDAYRTAHTALYEKPWRKTIPEAHTPLLNIMVKAFKGLGFNTIQEFFDASEELNFSEIANKEPRRSRYDLALIGEPRELDGIIIRPQGLSELELVIDGQPAMSTSLREHLSMEVAVRQCSDNARCFVAGLGLGLVLLYLAESGKTNEVIVCELDSRVIDLLGTQFKEWMSSHYPDFNFQIIHADAFDKVLELGKFDWLFFDTNLTELEASFKEMAKTALVAGGIYTAWQPCEVVGWK